MKMKNKSWSLILVILGVVVGALSTLCIQVATQRRVLLKAEYQDWRKLNLVLNQIELNYVDEIDRKQLTDAAVTAVLSKLDPHSVYLPPVEREESETSLAGGFDGIGIQFNVPNDTAVVIEVIPGGPSEKIGLLPGDRLLKVDDKVIAGVKFPQDSMVRRMRGHAGTKVTVTVKRGEEIIPFEITRGKIPSHSVDAAFMTGDTTGYLRLSKFSRTTCKECDEAIGKLIDSGMKYLIFDLRDNTGGYLDQAVLLSDLFLQKDSMVVYMEGLHRKREEFRASGRGRYQDLKLAVLINEGTASAAEIFAGAMQDNGRALVYGRRSFGKGLVQEPVNFSDGSGLKLTTARFYTPSGRCIQKPYSEDYALEVYKRYSEGEMLSADSLKLSKGGILPDVFVPIDTTKVSDFYLKCSRKATEMRFASDFFDHHAAELSAIDDYTQLLRYLDKAQLDTKFLEFARKKDGIEPRKGEWEESRDYLMVRIKALVGRYSKLGDNAFYHLWLEIDDCYHCAMKR